MFGDGGHRLGGGGGAYDRAPGSGVEGCDQCAAVESPVLAGSIGVLVLIGVAAVAAVMSLGTVPPLHFGIRYNHFSKAAATSAVYHPGRHFIGPFNKFMLFPATVQSIEFTDEMRLSFMGARYEPLHTRTKDGLGLHVKVSLQYRLPEETLGDLYNEFNLNYEPVITSSVRDVLIRAASEYEAAQFWQDRQRVGDQMQEMVDRELRKSHARCWGLQLMLIDLPDVFEHRMVVTQIQKQSMFIKEQEQRSAQIRAETSVIEAEFDRTVRVLTAGGQANYTVTTKHAQAEATQRRIAVESEVMGTVKKSLGLTPDGLVSYQRFSAMDDLESASVYFGFAGPSSVLAGGR